MDPHFQTPPKLPRPYLASAFLALILQMRACWKKYSLFVGQAADDKKMNHMRNLANNRSSCYLPRKRGLARAQKIVNHSLSFECDNTELW
jgi:hypothetical protein